MKVIMAAAAVAAALLGPAAKAADPLDASSLQEYCSVVRDAPESAAARLCLLYVNGFLDGAVITDERVTRNVVDQVDTRESLLDRAMRTRILGQLRDFGPSFYAEFCVGKSISVAVVADRVVEEFGRYESLDDIPAQAVVFSALRRHYPCVSQPA